MACTLVWTRVVLLIQGQHNSCIYEPHLYNAYQVIQKNVSHCVEASLLLRTCMRELCTFVAVLAVPDRPGPPVVLNVTHHSVELKWDAPSHDLDTGKLRYCLQEEGETSKGFTNVYK